MPPRRVSSRHVALAVSRTISKLVRAIRVLCNIECCDHRKDTRFRFRRALSSIGPPTQYHERVVPVMNSCEWFVGLARP